MSISDIAHTGPKKRLEKEASYTSEISCCFLMHISIHDYTAKLRERHWYNINSHPPPPLKGNEFWPKLKKGQNSKNITFRIMPLVLQCAR